MPIKVRTHQSGSSQKNKKLPCYQRLLSNLGVWLDMSSFLSGKCSRYSRFISDNFPWSFFPTPTWALFLKRKRWMSLCCKKGVARCCLQDGGFHGVRGVVKPFVLSGPRGCRSTITRGAVSSVKLFSRLIRRSGRCFSLQTGTQFYIGDV